MQAVSEARPRRGIDRAFWLASAIIVIGILSTSLAQTQVLAIIPLRNLLKNEFHVDRTVNAAFFFWLGLPWYFKPFIGILSDAFPLFGTRRKSYIMLGSAAAALAWFTLIVTSHQYSHFLVACLVVNVAMVVASTALGGYLVEAAQGSANSGRLTSVRNFVEQLCYVISGPVSGFLASIAFGWTALACGCITFMIFPGAWLLLRERAATTASTEVLRAAGQQFKTIARARSMWAAAGIAALFYFAPGVSTAVFYAQQNTLHMDTQGQGNLQFLSGVCGVAAALLYGIYGSRRYTLRTLLIVCMLFGAAGNLAYLFYTTIPRAQMIESFNGFGYTLAEVALMHLMVRATPRGSEALGFALLVSVRNLCIYGADWIGSSLLDNGHIDFHALVLANAGTSLLAVPAALLLPAALVGVRDANPADRLLDLNPVPVRVEK